jgi:hypothetical protein
MRLKLEAHFFDLEELPPFPMVVNVVKNLGLAILVVQKADKGVLPKHPILLFWIFAD